MNLQLNEDRILVLIEDNTDTTKTGIVIPDSAKKKPTTGKIVDIGPGRYTEYGFLTPMKFEIDDIVEFPENSGDKVVIDDQEYLILRSREILFTISNKSDIYLEDKTDDLPF